MPLTWTLKQWLQTDRGLIITADRPLRHLKELQEKIKHRTGNKISLRILHNLLEKQPKTLDYRILQLICDSFQCQLKDFCAVKPSSPPAENGTGVPIQHLLQPCAIAENECLRSFIARVQVAAIAQALSVTDNLNQAARLLGTHRGTLCWAQQRFEHYQDAARNHPPTTFKAIPLPPSIFTIGEKEDYKSFTRRIQRAAIQETFTLERNHTRSALRLGYERQSFSELRKSLQQHSIVSDFSETNMNQCLQPGSKNLAQE